MGRAEALEEKKKQKEEAAKKEAEKPAARKKVSPREFGSGCDKCLVKRVVIIGCHYHFHYCKIIGYCY